MVVFIKAVTFVLCCHCDNCQGTADCLVISSISQSVQALRILLLTSSGPDSCLMLTTHRVDLI